MENPLALAPLKRYRCLYSEEPVPLDPTLSHPLWKAAPWSDPFVDIEGAAKPKPRYLTRMKMLWDAKGLLIGAEMEEPHVWGTLTEHDSVIFQDNDFEVFLDPDGDHHLYIELELNALNTTWDLLLVKPYRAGGPPVDGFELKGLETAVSIRGTINDPRHTDDGWSCVIRIPWAALTQIAGCPVPPRRGDQWRINFSRVEWDHTVADGRYKKVPGKPEHNWVWCPQGVIDMHRPDRWGILEFVHDLAEPAREYPGLEARQQLIRRYEAHRAHRDRTGKWGDAVEISGQFPADMEISYTLSQFEAHWRGWAVNHEGRIWKL